MSTVTAKRQAVRVRDENVLQVARALGRYLENALGGEWELTLRNAARSCLDPDYEWENPL